ncbi:MAG: hypothetical protein GY774_03905 [Planctomycetes bacterium]|nr:hypothetical protein [Planctomycetota bacterium]
MSERKDLTRWNRAGRTRFRYVDGKAAEYLEILRQQLVNKFKDAKSERCEWLKPAEEIPANEKEPEAETETLFQRQERLSRTQERILKKMYHQDRRDWAWEITRTFARACHILTEYADAYANEGYLGTATQWDNVRRLVEMLDYHPAPPASAYTRLAFIAKENKTEKQSETGKENKKNKTGIVAKGFQVKYSPPMGGDTIIFETLEDLFVDPALNELHPKDWNQSDDPASPNGNSNNGNTQSSAEEQQYSNIANERAIYIQGVGDVSEGTLYTLVEGLKIKDFLDLDPDNAGLDDIETSLLWEWKAKANFLINFAPECNWTAIKNWSLPDIDKASAESLADVSGNSLEMMRSLKLDIEIIEICLDYDKYEDDKGEKIKLSDLVAPVAAGAAEEAVVTSWLAKRKPKIEPGDVAMIYREFIDENTGKYVDEAEAATIASIEKQTEIIHLTSSSDQRNWYDWKKSEARLKVSPRWKRKCWLNVDDVIRTMEPHGFTKDAYINWQEDEKWRYAKVKEADKRTMRLELDGSLPQPGAEIVMSHTFDGDKLPADYQEIALINDAGEDKEPKVDPKKPELVEPDYPEGIPNPIFKINKIFPIDSGDGGGTDGGGGGGLLPPASLPKIGSFLFPSPMLPMDLVKAAVELLLSLGVMQIPSTGEFVLKGMPFGGMLEGASDVMTAATKLVELLDGLNMSAKWVRSDEDDWVDARLFEEKIEFDADNNPTMTHTPIYFELNCENGAVPAWAAYANVKVVNSVGEDVPKDSLGCLNGKVHVFNNSVDPPQPVDPLQPVGYQPFSSADDGTLVQFKLTEWADENNKQANMEKLLEDAQNDASVLFKLIDKRLYDESGEVVEDEFGNAVEISGPLLAVSEVPLVKAVVEASDPLYVFNGSPGKIESGDWVVGEFADRLRALKISAIDEYSDSDKTETFSLSFENQDEINAELKKVYADFRGELIAEGATENTAAIESKELELEDVPESLKTGSEVLLTAEGKKPVAAKIESIVGNKITTNPSAEDFTKGELKILANIVLAGHGEKKPEKILGSGNAAKTNQEFILEVGGVSFTPDATKSSGVAAAIEVEVAGRVWEQVSTLKDSTPGDHHYAIRITEEGYVKIIFGDGEYGRRLPSGKNNIRVRYRVGSGLSGNVPAGGLEKPVNPHPLIKSVLQPLQAAGGGDMEDMASLRENAPPTLLALERAVSLSDFSHLAAAQSSIWQAKAYSPILDEGRMERVKVVIVPADGVISDGIKDDIEKFLQKHAMPGVQVTVENFNPVLFDLSVKVRVKTDEFIAEEVKKAVTTAVKDHFTLQNRKLGENLYLSEVYKVVETVRGVENSICVLNNDDTLQLIRAANESTVVYLDTDVVYPDIEAHKKPSTLTVTHEEYKP